MLPRGDLLGMMSSLVAIAARLELPDRARRRDWITPA
jgi:hypothetical protein